MLPEVHHFPRQGCSKLRNINSLSRLVVRFVRLSHLEDGRVGPGKQPAVVVLPVRALRIVGQHRLHERLRQGCPAVLGLVVDLWDQARTTLSTAAGVCWTLRVDHMQVFLEGSAGKRGKRQTKTWVKHTVWG